MSDRLLSCSRSNVIYGWGETTIVSIQQREGHSNWLREHTVLLPTFWPQTLCYDWGLVVAVETMKGWFR